MISDDCRTCGNHQNASKMANGIHARREREEDFLVTPIFFAIRPYARFRPCTHAQGGRERKSWKREVPDEAEVQTSPPTETTELFAMRATGNHRGSVVSGSMATGTRQDHPVSAMRSVLCSPWAR